VLFPDLVDPTLAIRPDSVNDPEEAISERSLFLDPEEAISERSSLFLDPAGGAIRNQLMIRNLRFVSTSSPLSFSAVELIQLPVMSSM
jgi:hypothetical protein